MSDVEIKFERENLDGIVAEGTYLIDAMKRFGVRPEEACIIPENLHFCMVQITGGADKLSKPTADEIEYFKVNGQEKNERLACQVVIEKGGEITLVTRRRKGQRRQERNQSEDYRKVFEEMPLEKIVNLVG
jgi:ferredoxin